MLRSPVPTNRVSPKAEAGSEGAGPLRPDAGLVKMSALARRSGVPASTIKHYIRLGLLPPPVTRPNKQMAYYDEGLVDRIQAIRILQTERFLPLSTIAKILGDPPRPGERRAETLRAQQLVTLEPAITQPILRTRTRAEVLRDLRVREDELDLLLERGLLQPGEDETGQPTYGDADLEILQLLHESRVAGLGDVFPPEVIEPYVDAVRSLVRLEIDIFRHRVSSGVSLPSPSMVEIASAAMRLGERLILALRRKLIVAELREQAVAPPLRPPPPPSRPARKPGRRPASRPRRAR